jgi:hypothetical protein
MRSSLLVVVVAAAALAAAACESSAVSRALGARCDSSDECDDRCLTSPEYPGGFCSVSCDDDGDCPSGARCVAEQGGVCLFDCRLDDAGVSDDCEFLGTGWACALRAGKPDGEVEVCDGP